MSNFPRVALFAVFIAIGLIAWASLPSVGAQTAKPTETRGISLKGAKTLPPDDQIPALKGYALR